MFTEIEVECLPEFLAPLRNHGIEALVVLGPDVNCKKNRGRALRTMHPWNMHRAAKALSCCETVADIEFESAPLITRECLHSGNFARTNWAPLWIKQGFNSLYIVKIPIAMDRHFECLLFSRREGSSQAEASAIAFHVLTAWPKIKHEILSKQQLLTRAEQLVLRLSALGDTSQQVAVRANMSERMVNFHIGSSLRKLNASNKTSAILKAIMMGIL
ncbi:helix-turn-helix transcriptional regulator [Curvibacter sp. APW13]|uniref:response regulator transcription factor n=1 Tax=Curvibacter sp. APW13 TaxID=3077236 RepID=UPI0028DEE90F|nr:helix-turn-helix transcriptional regulator [Curvibacter sp. APW13]MDT8992824.1 helix-turn-helix transcriptional regulator [Curvibacter sp. APW13]